MNGLLKNRCVGALKNYRFQRTLNNNNNNKMETNAYASTCSKPMTPFTQKKQPVSIVEKNANDFECKFKSIYKRDLIISNIVFRESFSSASRF